MGEIVSMKRVKNIIEVHLQSVCTDARMSDFTRKIRYTPSNIKIKNCIVENADRFLHYNFSGNEPWQKNKPLESIEFENVTAVNVKNPITAYGAKDCPISLSLKRCNIYFADERENSSFMHLCNVDTVDLSGTIVKNFKNDVLTKKWNDSGNIKFDNFVCENFNGEYCIITDEPFYCKAI